MIKKFAILTGLAMTTTAASAATALVNFSGGSTTGTAVANTNSLSSGTLSIAAGSVLDLSGVAISGLGITATTSGGVHTNGSGAVLTAATVAKNTTIGGVFSAYQHANSSSWGPSGEGTGNTYTISLTGLMAGTTYTVNVLSGRDGGIGLPGSMSSTWTVGTGAATLNIGASQFDMWDQSAGTSPVIQETGTGPYTMAYSLEKTDAGMTTWVFNVAADNTTVNLGFVNPINSMLITVPEPSAALLGALGCLALLRRRRN